MPTYKKNTSATYASNTPDQRVFSISFARLMAIIAGAVITSAIGTAFAISRTSISDHFLLVSVSADVERLNVETVKRDVYNADIQYIKDSITEIKNDIKEIKNK